MKYLALVTLIILTACTIQPVKDLRAPAVAAATQTARAEAIPPVTVEPSLVPTVTPTPCDPVILGNIDAQGNKIAHSPGQANYKNVVIEESKGNHVESNGTDYPDAKSALAGLLGSDSHRPHLLGEPGFQDRVVYGVGASGGDYVFLGCPPEE